MVRDSLYINELGGDEVEEMWDEKFGREVYDVFSTFFAFDRQLDTLTSLGLPLGWGDDWKYVRQLCTKAKRSTDEGEAAKRSEWWGFALKKIGGLILTIFLITSGGTVAI
jgi:hypothetical protein